MILCKYINTIGCLDIIKNMRLKAADVKTFNDPFELLPGIDGKPEKDKFLDHIRHIFLPKLTKNIKKTLPDFDGKFILNDDDTAFMDFERKIAPALRREINNGLERASKTTRIISFNNPKLSNQQDEILLWSHYAEKHEGVRVFFETDNIKVHSNNLFPVKYSAERIKIDMSDPGTLKEQAELAYNDILVTKNISWKYEQEMRWIISLLECFQDGECTYVQLHPDVIKRIDFGCKCNKNDILSIISKDVLYKHVELYQAEIHKHKFCLEYKEIRSS